MRVTRPTVAIAASAVTATMLVTGAPAHAAGQIGPATSFTLNVDEATGSVPTPTSGASIPNIDSVKSTIRAYYNVSTEGASKGLANPGSSRYLSQVGVIEDKLKALPAVAAADHKAVVFDIDD